MDKNRFHLFRTCLLKISILLLKFSISTGSLKNEKSKENKYISNVGIGA